MREREKRRKKGGENEEEEAEGGRRGGGLSGEGGRTKADIDRLVQRGAGASVVILSTISFHHICLSTKDGKGVALRRPTTYDIPSPPARPGRIGGVTDKA